MEYLIGLVAIVVLYGLVEQIHARRRTPSRNRSSPHVTDGSPVDQAGRCA